MAFMKVRKSDGTLTDMLIFKGDPGRPGENAKFSYGDTLPDTMEDGEVFFKTDGADYIVEQGTSGIWTYRKWNSGIAECWGTNQATGSITAAWGNVYETSGDLFPGVDYPFEFIEVPICMATPANCGSNQFFIGMVPEGGGTTTHTPVFDGLRGTAGTSNVIFSISYHAIGRWK